MGPLLSVCSGVPSCVLIYYIIETVWSPQLPSSVSAPPGSLSAPLWLSLPRELHFPICTRTYLTLPHFCALFMSVLLQLVSYRPKLACKSCQCEYGLATPTCRPSEHKDIKNSLRNFFLWVIDLNLREDCCSRTPMI